MSAKSAIQCEVCGGRVRHGDLVVGCKLSGVRRVVCNRRSCRRTWKKHGAEFASLWAENQKGPGELADHFSPRLHPRKKSP